MHKGCLYVCFMLEFDGDSDNDDDACYSICASRVRFLHTRMVSLLLL